jgi:hypothetical protein
MDNFAGRNDMPAARTENDNRRQLNPLFNDNKLKLGLFGVNVSNGCAITTAEDRHTVSWPTNLAIAQTADKYGYEALVPVARWRGFGGESNFNGTNFETYTWAAGLGQATKDICVLTTSHVPTIHPIVAAKQATTVDHITNGRFALNIVCGWFTPELEMFGVPQMEHDTRYDHAAEWVEVMKLLWSREEDFDYEGQQGLRHAEADPEAVPGADECGRLRERPAFRGQALRHRVRGADLAQSRGGPRANRCVSPAGARGIRTRDSDLGQRLRRARRHAEGS